MRTPLRITFQNTPSSAAIRQLIPIHARKHDVTQFHRLRLTGNVVGLVRIGNELAFGGRTLGY